MKKLLVICFAAAFAAGFAGCAGCDDGGTDIEDAGGGEGGDDAGGTEDAGGESDAGGEQDAGSTDGGNEPTCKALGGQCVAGDVCCVGVCTATGVCEKVSVECGKAGTACTNGTDCCTGRCSGGACSATQCVDNGQACTGNGDCCSANCSGGTCQSVNFDACKVEGQACTGGTECCSTNCKNNVCAAAYTCRAPNDLCFKDDDCCSAQCSKNDGSAGFCQIPSGGCTQDGVPCSGSSTCCTRVCADPGTGTTVCLPASGCKMTGAPCLDNQGCCGGGSNPNGSVTCRRDVPTDKYGRCDNGVSCNPVGNICGAKFPTPDGGLFSVNASQNCCDGKTQVCKLDSSGIPRCYGGGSTACPDGYTGEAGCCIDIGQLCQFKDQCCDGAPCVPDNAGLLRCTASTCTPLGEACTPGDGGTECCSGQCLAGEIGHSCQVPTTRPDAGDLCKGNGTACANASECCSQVCSGGVCTVDNPCQGRDEVCTTSGDCCTGLSCVIPQGSSSGTCRDSSCGAAGQSCSPSSGCCAGYLCLKDGTVQTCDGTTSCTCTVVIG